MSDYFIKLNRGRRTVSEIDPGAHGDVRGPYCGPVARPKFALPTDPLAPKFVRLNGLKASARNCRRNHDRDRIYSHDLDQGVETMDVRVLRTPVESPKANGYCERLVQTARRECLDFLILLSESPLKRTLVD